MDSFNNYGRNDLNEVNETLTQMTDGNIYVCVDMFVRLLGLFYHDSFSDIFRKFRIFVQVKF